MERALTPAVRAFHELASWTRTPNLRRYGSVADGNGRIEVIGPVTECRAIARLAFANAHFVDLGPISYRELMHSVVAPLASDVLVGCVPRSLVRSLCHEGSFWLPQSIEGLVGVGRPWNELVHVWPNARRYASLVKRQGLSCEVREVDAALPAFLTMYETYLMERFGQDAKIESPDFFRRYGSTGEIVVVTREGRWAAAGFNVRHAKRYRLLALALSAPSDRRIGAGHAYYLFSLGRARALGYEQADLGPERPFLDEPGLRYKRGWGLRIAPNPFAIGAFVFRLATREDPFRRVLSKARMIALREGRPWGIAVSTNTMDRHELAESLASRYAPFGVEGFDVI